VAATSSQIVLDAPPSDFPRPAAYRRTCKGRDPAGENGAAILFILVHGPDVEAVIDRLAADNRICPA
jgi:hypothetical protein